MKKILICICLLAILLVGCGSESEEKETVFSVNKDLSATKNNNDEDVTNDDNTAKEEITDNSEETDVTEEKDISVEILAEYTLPDSIGWYTRHFMVIKNNSDVTVDVSTSSIAYDKDGNVVSADDSEFDALGAGCTSVMYEAFETNVDIDHYETSIKTSKSGFYKSVIQDLSYVENDIDGGAVFQVTNNGEKSAEFVEGYALFFLNDELVGYSSEYFTDDDFEIKPGKTISKQVTAYTDFDRIEFYLTGRR